MKAEPKSLFKKFTDWLYELSKEFSIIRYDNKIISIPSVVFYLQCRFHELVKLVHVHISKELRRQISNRYTLWTEQIRISACEALDYFLKKPQDFFVSDFLLEQSKENVVVDSIKKFPDIALKHKTGASVISRYFPCHLYASEDSFVRALVYSTGKRFSNERWFIDSIQDIENSVMENSVSYSRLVYVSTLRVMNKEIAIPAVLIGFILQISLQFKYILLKVFLKTHDVLFTPLATFEFVPCRKQILRVDNFCK